MNDVDAFTRILEWARMALDAHDAPLSPALASRSFAWTGGGEGPAPPIEP